MRDRRITGPAERDPVAHSRLPDHEHAVLAERPPQLRHVPVGITTEQVGRQYPARGKRGAAAIVERLRRQRLRDAGCVVSVQQQQVEGPPPRRDEARPVIQHHRQARVVVGDRELVAQREHARVVFHRLDARARQLRMTELHLRTAAQSDDPDAARPRPP